MDAVGKWLQISIFAGVFLALTPSGFAQATCPTQSKVEIQNLTTTAEKVWDERYTERRRALGAGRDDAKSLAPGRVRDLNLTFEPEFSLDGQSHEYIGAATLAVELGSLSEARRGAIHADWQALESELLVERWRFVDEVQDAYLAWRGHELERGHLEVYLSEANEELEPIRQAQGRQLISKLDLADMEAEVAWIRAELAEAGRRSRLAAARLEALLGVQCPLELPRATHDAPDKANPWSALVSRAQAFPEVRVYEARRAALEARAHVHEVAHPMLLEIGVGARTVAFHENFLGPVLGLTLPLQHPEGPDAALARAEAEAQKSAAEWVAVRIRSELEAEASNFDVLVQGYFELLDGYVRPLEERAALMSEAFKASQVEIDRVIRARRELHEAEHQLILHRAEIDARRLKAGAIQKLLEQSGNTGGNP